MPFGMELPSYLVILLYIGLAPGDIIATTFHKHLKNFIDVKTIANHDRMTNRITPETLENVYQECLKTVEQKAELERRLSEAGRVIRPTDRKTDPSLIRNRMADPFIHIEEKTQMIFEEVAENLIQRFNLTKDDVNNDLPRYTLSGGLQAKSDACNTRHPEERCDASSRYRTVNGQCNNLNNPTWGMAMSCQQRILPASYVGASGYRRSVSGNALPEPRTLSLNLHYHVNRPTNYVTHMYMFFGQLLDHDIALTPFSTTLDNAAIECCPPADETHPQCRPILVRRNDPFYSRFNVTCLNFVRSVICPTCTMGARQQMDQVTSFIDASFVYGNSNNVTANLRTNDGTGRLRITESNFGDLLPRSPNPQEDQCSFPATNDICFDSGDPRANQHNVLTSLHTIFMREHNRIATVLRQINSRWNEERIFQEARRIVGAQMQVITYKEYLPITLGANRMTYFRLWVSDSGTTVYDSRKNPTMISEFSTAAFRFGHSLINQVVSESPLNGTNGRRLLRNEFFQPFELYNGIIGPLVRGASNSPAQWFDRHLVEDVTNFLYRIRGNETGLDLAAFNINRGRDHGIPPYIDMVLYCSDNEIRVRNFNDLVRNRLMTSENAQALSRNYEFVDDVDLWAGILMETPNDGAVVGPTAACIIGTQFQNMKFGDRFYFEHRREAGSFTYQQLQVLRRTSLSYILCLNSDANQLPRNPMLFSSRNNPVIYCKYVKGLDLSYWKE